MTTPSFCVSPWHTVAVDTLGQFRVCCFSSWGKNNLLNENNEILKIYEQKLETISKSKTIQLIRKQMLEGKRPEMCSLCFKQEDSGVKSHRQFLNERWFNPLLNYAVQDPMRVKYIDLRLSNVCNLRCRMCNPYSSHLWVNEWNEVAQIAELVPQTILSQDEKIKLSKLDWPSSHDTWNNIISLIDTVDEICLTGGEPTLEKKQYEFFDKLIQADKAKQIQLKYNTNLTHLPTKLLNYWSKFKSIHLNVSIDATGDLNTYIRYPSEWEIIEKNLDLVRQIPYIYVKVNCTVQMYNILRLENLINWISKKENVSLNLNFLNHPRALNIKTLPIELKLETVKKLKTFSELAQINELVAYMMSEDTSQWLPEFYSYTEKLDQLRHENLFLLIPEFLKFKSHHAL